MHKVWQELSTPQLILRNHERKHIQENIPVHPWLHRTHTHLYAKVNNKYVFLWLLDGPFLWGFFFSFYDWRIKHTQYFLPPSLKQKNKRILMTARLFPFCVFFFLKYTMMMNPTKHFWCLILKGKTSTEHHPFKSMNKSYETAMLI